MAGRILEEDIAAVRERARILEVIGPYVTLRRAGGDSYKGLCPFHDERTPSFQVTPSRGLYYCFGCGEGGDAIRFLERIDNLSFVEAVERLADQFGVRLRYEEGDRGDGTGINRRRITEANRLAAEFFAEALTGPDALTARRFLDGRGFDRAAAEHFGLGFAPREGRALHEFLRSRGFRDEELVTAGLIRERGGWDFFQGRLIWPIRDAGGVVLGFGGRRLFDDDRLPAKYINTPETPVYKKSHVLYGLDLARQPIARTSQAVVVEGYTDVMAAHLAGVDTAVASCGTAFGADHGRILQRLIGQTAAGRGEVVFTFDGDEAGQAAAMKVFNGDAAFITQTYVAVEPHGWDPCDLRMNEGDAAVRELVGRRVPLYRFVMRNVIARYDLDRADGRLAALRAAAPLVVSIRDRSLVAAYARELAGMLGMDPDEVRRDVDRAGRAPGSAAAVRVEPTPDLPDPRTPELMVERGTTQLMVQVPWLFSPDWAGLTSDDFVHPAYRRIAQTVRLVYAAWGDPDGTVPAGFDTAEWAQLLREGCDDPATEKVLIALSVEPVMREPDPRYVDAYAARLQLLRVNEAIAGLKSRLQRTNPLDHPDEHRQMFTDLLAWEGARKDLQSRSVAVPD